MRKYFEVFRLSFKMQIVWRFDVAMTMFATISRIVAAWILWNAIFSGKALVSGFTFQAMLSYYLVSSFLTSLDLSGQISGEVSYLIRDGGFTKYMVTPLNPLGFFSFRTAGEAAFQLGFSCLAAVICALLLPINIILTSDIKQIFLAIVMILLGLLCMMCFHHLLGMLAFKFLSVSTFLHAANNLTAFLTGALIPLALLPEWSITAMRMFPFYYVTYLPAMLLTGQSGEEALTGVITLACWTGGLLALNHFIYHKLRVQYDGVGI
ncbi:ABC-2 family transporter protein [Desulfosporosinus sp. PR]|uniref:ABC transporter permease n=1 Tax=Candidatus Desulfosporosinus nitrosoreducens TaxID=3401928 RepID=UPI0027E6D228|nr:ABC-2 family transporter protein [Desulfosporosinus sp. PR]MDQ7094336.1 ABC-2 family transporter protein [Desulfosporosinus sp. PR]